MWCRIKTWWQQHRLHWNTSFLPDQTFSSLMKYHVTIWGDIKQGHSATMWSPVEAPDIAEGPMRENVPLVRLRVQGLSDTYSHSFFKFLIGHFPALYPKNLTMLLLWIDWILSEYMGQISLWSTHQCQGQSSQSSSNALHHRMTSPSENLSYLVVIISNAFMLRTLQQRPQRDLRDFMFFLDPPADLLPKDSSSHGCGYFCFLQHGESPTLISLPCWLPCLTKATSLSSIRESQQRVYI